MTTTDITKTILLLFALILLGWDIVVAVNATPGDTISEVMGGWSWRCQSAPFAVGVIAGHLFWPARYARNKFTKRCRVRVLWVVGFAVLAADIWLVAELFPAFPLLAGIVSGRLLWAQSPNLRRSIRHG